MLHAISGVSIMAQPTAAIVLAAGKGTRMQSDLPKVLHRAADRSLARWVFDACSDAGAAPIVLVVGYGDAQVRSEFAGEAAACFARQEEQLGTGHAVQQAEAIVRDSGAHDVFVLCGDGPLIRPDTLRQLRDQRRIAGAACALATATLPDPSGYGRVVRDEAGRFQSFVEEKNASAAQRAICEINPSYYCFAVDALFAALRDVVRDPVSGEFYLTDVPPMLAARGMVVEVVEGLTSEDAASVNTVEHLGEAERVLRARLNGAMTQGES